MLSTAKAQRSVKRQIKRKIITFQLGTEWYALPIEKVQRILDEFSPHGDLGNGRGLVRAQQETLTLMDPAHLFPSSLDDRERQYLMVCSLAGGRSAGIPVPQLPRVFEILEEQIQPIPELYQHSGVPAGVVGLIHLQEGPEEVFYLDLDHLSIS